MSLELAQPVVRYLVDSRVDAGHRAHQQCTARQVRHVSGELSRRVDRNRLRRIAGFVQDLDFARLDDEECEIPVAHLEQLLSGATLLQARAGAVDELLNLLRRQPRERGGGETVIG